MFQMIKRLFVLIFSIALGAITCAAQAKHVPSVDELLTIQSVGGTQISPDGKWIAYTINYGDFKQDAFVTQICLVNAETDKLLSSTLIDEVRARRGNPNGSQTRLRLTYDRCSAARGRFERAVSRKASQSPIRHDPDR
jgi:Tol biopolymer transport system component